MADKWEEFSSRVRAGEPPQKVLDEMGMLRYCCRRMLISHVDIIDDILEYSEAAAKKAKVT